MPSALNDLMQFSPQDIASRIFNEFSFVLMTSVSTLININGINILTWRVCMSIHV